MPTTLDPLTSDWIDGPGLVEFLAGMRITSSSANSRLNKERLRRWRRGGRAFVYDVDEVLVKESRDLHLRDVPEHLYRGHPLSPVESAAT
jgi:hypothetical protein